MTLEDLETALHEINVRADMEKATLAGLEKSLERLRIERGELLLDGGDVGPIDGKIHETATAVDHSRDLVEAIDRSYRSLKKDFETANEVLCKAQKKARRESNERLFIAMLKPCLDFARTSKEFVFDCRSLGGVGGPLGRPALPWVQLMQLFNQDDHTLRAIKKYIADHE